MQLQQFFKVNMKHTLLKAQFGAELISPGCYPVISGLTHVVGGSQDCLWVVKGIGILGRGPQKKADWGVQRAERLVIDCHTTLAYIIGLCEPVKKITLTFKTDASVAVYKHNRIYFYYFFMNI